MAPTNAIRILLAVMVALGIVGGIDAGRAGSWDLVVILGALTLGVVVVLLSISAGRPLVPVRADLVRWLGRRAAVSGETPSAVADRAIAAYRSGLTAQEGRSDALADR